MVPLIHYLRGREQEREIGVNKFIFILQVRSWTSKGPGPYSDILHLHTEPDLVRAPMSLQGLATSESSIEIWWEPVPSRGKVIGYQVCLQLNHSELEVILV